MTCVPLPQVLMPRIRESVDRGARYTERRASFVDRSLKTPRRLMVAALVFICTLACGADSSAQSFRLLEIPPPPGDIAVVLHDMNNQLQIVGQSNSGRAIYWDPSGTKVLDLPSSLTAPLVINNVGVIAGTRRTSTGYFPAQLFTIANGVLTDIHSPVMADGWVRPLRITDSNILFVERPLHGLNTAFYLSQVYELPDATDVNTHGVVVGHHHDPPWSRAFIRSPDGRERLLRQTPLPVFISSERIGDGGHVVSATSSDAGTELLLITPDGAVELIPVPRGYFVHPSRPNRSGDIVGTINPDGRFVNDSFPFLYRGGQLIDLRTLVSIPYGPIREARLITDNGAIIVSASPSWFSERRDYVLIPEAPPAPGPVTFMLFGRTVAVQWPAIPGAVDYVLEAGSAPGLRDLYSAVIGSHSLVTSAPPGRYFVRVRARNRAGTSDPSNEVLIEVP